MRTVSRVIGGILLLGAGCAPRPAQDPLRAESVPTRDELRGPLVSLEATFYRHWGAVEGTPEFRSFRAAHVPALREWVEANHPLSLMALRVLDRLAPGERVSPAARAILLTSALARERNFARWGVISPSGFLPGVCGGELLALGREAVGPLHRLLRDTRRAHVWGGEGERVNQAQGDRVCDYAWVLLSTLLDQPLSYHPDPARRDPQIRALDLRLDRR